MSDLPDEIKQNLKHIDEVCKKIAERDGFKLHPVGGFIKKANEYGGTWAFVEGEGRYELKDGEMQWKLKSIK